MAPGDDPNAKEEMARRLAKAATDPDLQARLLGIAEEFGAEARAAARPHLKLVRKDDGA